MLTHDVEAPETAGQKKRRPWYSLLLISLIYVWPDDLGMQLRAGVCLLIVIIVRCLNLAVPIIYKNVVDVLANVSNRIHPSSGLPEKFSFMQVGPPKLQFSPRNSSINTGQKLSSEDPSRSVIFFTRCGDSNLAVSAWQVFYPWVLAYMVCAFLQGGPGGGSVGLLSNLRQYLWIPISQQAYRCES